MILRKLYYKLSPSARMAVRKIVYFPLDLLAKSSNKNELIPPKGMIYTGGGDFKETGQRFLNYFTKYGDLKPKSSVLDIGSGIGRLAIPLTSYLNLGGTYNGFDVIAQGVDWCNQNINSQFPNFKFHHIELKNDLYRNDGSEAKEYIFPINDRSQDFIFLISVFTHLVPVEMEHYISEISRMLNVGKTCFATFFVLDKERPDDNPKFRFKYQYGHFALMDDKVTSANVAFEKEYLMEVFSKNGLVVQHFLPGHWRDPKLKMETLDFQDIIVLKKT